MYLHLFFLRNEKVLLMILFYHKSNYFITPEASVSLFLMSCTSYSPL